MPVDIGGVIWWGLYTGYDMKALLLLMIVNSSRGTESRRCKLSALMLKVERIQQHYIRSTINKSG